MSKVEGRCFRLQLRLNKAFMPFLAEGAPHFEDFYMLKVKVGFRLGTDLQELEESCISSVAVSTADWSGENFRGKLFFFFFSTGMDLVQYSYY